MIPSSLVLRLKSQAACLAKERQAALSFLAVAAKVVLMSLGARGLLPSRVTSTPTVLANCFSMELATTVYAAVRAASCSSSMDEDRMMDDAAATAARGPAQHSSSSRGPNGMKSGSL